MKPFFLFLPFIVLGSAIFAGFTDEPVRLYEPVESGPILTQEMLGQERFHFNTQLLQTSGIRTLYELPEDPFLAQQWYFHNFGQADSKGVIGKQGADIKLFPALEIFQPSRQVVLAVIDSGLDLLHEDIDPEVLWMNPGETGFDENGDEKSTNGIDDDGNGYVDDLHGWNLVKDNPNIQDRHYHGTHVNAILSAVRSNRVGITGGFQPLKIMLLKIFGLGSTANRDKIAEGIRYACENGARVINASWGSRYRNDQIESAIRLCHDKGVLFVGAAGNSRRNLDEEPDFPSAYDLPNQVVVSATDNRDRPSPFANFGSMVDIAAPGSLILSLLPKNKYRAFSGTSQASPMVAGAAALLFAQEPTLSHLQVKERLLQSADQSVALKRWVSSAGRLNVYNLLSGKKGKRIENYPELEWHTLNYALESPHPYGYDMNEKYEISVPGAALISIHFERFEFDKYNDTLSVQTAEGEVIEYLNSHLGSFWSEPVAGEKVVLNLVSNDKVNQWGFLIDKIKFVKTKDFPKF